MMFCKVADAECLEATTSSMLPHFPKIVDDSMKFKPVLLAKSTPSL